MVRLQKIAYERIVNTAALGRSREISSPRKWHTINPFSQARLFAWDFFNNSLLGKILKPFVSLYNRVEDNFNRDLLLQQGLTFEDKFLHHDSELRRCNLFEHVARQTLHPYHWILKVRRRERYFRVERTCRGFFAPDYIRSEAATQTFADFEKLQIEWRDHTHNNYWSDITPTARRTILPKFIVLELLLNYGVLRNEAWSRYFFNQQDSSFYTEKELAIVKDRKRFPWDLTTPAGKRTFEEYVNSYNDKNPGILAPEGQKFDFKAYYEEIGV